MKNLKLKLTIILITQILAFQVTAQLKNFEKATVMLTGGDQLEGFIEQSPSSELGKEIVFMASENSEKRIFNPKDVDWFSLGGNVEKYKPVDIHFFQGQGVYRKKVEDIRFGIILFEGDWNLTKVYLDKREYDNKVVGRGIPNYVYILERKGETFQLDQLELRVDEYNVLLGHRKFNGILNYVTMDCKMKSLRSSLVKFNDKSLLSFFNDYFICSEEKENIVFYKKKLKSKSRVSSFVKWNYSIFNGDDNYDSRIALGAGFETRVLFPIMDRRGGMTIGVEYFYHDYYNNYDKREGYKHNLRIPIYFNIVAVRNKDFLWYLNLGTHTYLKIDSDQKSWFYKGPSNLDLSFGTTVEYKRLKFQVVLSRFTGFELGYRLNKGNNDR